MKNVRCPRPSVIVRLAVLVILTGVLPVALTLARPNPRPLPQPAPGPSPSQPISVAVSPSDSGLTVTQSLTLAATVLNDSSNSGVTWSVSGSSCSGSSCGTVAATSSTSAVYTAPSTAGIYYVTATSVADVTQSSTATIGVTDLAGVYTYRNDYSRSSVNPKEYALNLSNVNNSSFGKLFSCAVDGAIYAQPLWVANETVGGTKHNIVIVATQNDSVYAFDADNGNGTACTLYWHASLVGTAYGAAAGATPIPAADTGETGDIQNEIGITSTPVVDPTTNTLYVVSNTKEGTNYYQRLHKLNVSTGAEMSGAPTNITASVSGTGNGSSGGTLSYSALHQNARPGLALVNGSIYISAGSHGDNEPWHGWVLQYNASTLALTGAYCTTPNTSGGGIWMAGNAPVFDSSNNLYVITSNGTYDGKTEFADSFLKLATTSGLSLSDYFTPYDQATLGSTNTDLGQGGAVTLMDSVTGPYPHLLIGGGKEGIIYLLNRDNMGHYNSSNNNAAVQTWQLVPNGGNYEGIASAGEFWQNTFYIAGSGTALEAFAFNTSTGMFNTTPTSSSLVTFGFPGITPALSALGTANAIVWGIDSSMNGTNGAGSGPAVLYAFDASNLANELWDSSMSASNQAATAVKFAVPTVANGKVYVATVSELDVYGLLNQGPAAAAPTFSPAPGTYASAQTVTLSDGTSGATIYYTVDGSTPTTASAVYSAPISVTATTRINAMAAVAGLTNSTVSSGTYTIQGSSGTTITYIQGAYSTPQSSQTTVSVTYPQAQTAGDLNVVVVGWNDTTAAVSSVTDTSGASYTRALGPTQISGTLSQSIYYLKNIPAAAAGANTVKVTFSTAAAYPDIRILEYNGADPNSPVDVTSAATGNGGTANSGSTTTTNPNDLIFGADIVTGLTTGPGTGFTQRILTAPDGDIVEDKTATASGSYSATAPASGQWIMQMVAFKGAGGSSGNTPPTAPSNLVGPNPQVIAEQGYDNPTFLTTHTTSPFDSTGGDMLVLFASSHAGVNMTPSDTYNNTWISIAGPTNTSTGFDLRSQMWYVKNPVVGPGETVSVTLSTAESFVMSVFVVKGSYIPAPLDAFSAIGDDGGTQSLNVASPSIQAAIADDLLLGWAKSSVSETFTSGAGFTPQPNASGPFLDSESEPVAAPGSYDATFTLSTAATWQSSVVAVEPPVTSASATQINLSWAASTDNVGVTGYFVERCTGSNCSNFAQIGSTTGTTFTDTGLSPSTVYSYRVRATDASGYLSAYSNVAVASTQASQAPPTVSSITPNGGSTAGGTAVTITGTNFASGAAASIGGAAATNVVVSSSTQITATTPAGAAGPATVTVTVSGQSGSLTNGFTYVVTPTVSSISPNSGPTTGGTAVTITGSNFASGATVTIGGTAAINVVVVSATQITATTPAGTAGPATVKVTANGQSGSLTNGFTYIAPATVTSISPTSGSTAGGTAVTITGTNFAAGATVSIGANSATNVVVASSTQITATTPAGTAGSATVTVTNPGVAGGSLTNGFTYVVTPTVSSISPNSGPTTGGTAVTITGSNFASGTTVTIGGTAATNVVVASSTQITATTPTGVAGPASVAVTVSGQTGTLLNGFTYLSAVPISYSQVAAATPQSAQSTVAVTYPAAQTAGDLNIVVVGWNDTTATVQSVTDSAGNTYTLAIGPTSGTALRQSIYYAANIRGGANTVTVQFSQAATYPDIRILEYRGVNTLDAKIGASGSGTSASSGSATTTSANELIFAADTITTTTTGAGTGFTSRIITSPDSDIAEDKTVTAIGSYSATASLSSGAWVMQMVTFK